MALSFFKRNKQDTDVLPTEVREYYENERRERTGVAWLLALGTLVLTFVIAAALFFGGRWAYHVAFSNDKDNDGQQTTSQDDGLRVDEKGNVTSGTQSTTTGNTGTSSTNTTTPSAPTATPGTSTTTTPTTTPNTGDVAPAALVNTGPGDE